MTESTEKSTTSELLIEGIRYLPSRPQNHGGEHEITAIGLTLLQLTSPPPETTHWSIAAKFDSLRSANR